MLAKSTFIIMGQIISQMSTAMGIETFAYSNRPRNAGMPGKNLPISTPATMHRTTQRERNLSKKPIFNALSCFTLAFSNFMISAVPGAKE